MLCLFVKKNNFADVSEHRTGGRREYKPSRKLSVQLINRSSSDSFKSDRTRRRKKSSKSSSDVNGSQPLEKDKEKSEEPAGKRMKPSEPVQDNNSTPLTSTGVNMELPSVDQLENVFEETDTEAETQEGPVFSAMVAQLGGTDEEPLPQSFEDLQDINAEDMRIPVLPALAPRLSNHSQLPPGQVRNSASRLPGLPSSPTAGGTSESTRTEDSPPSPPHGRQPRGSSDDEIESYIHHLDGRPWEMGWEGCGEYKTLPPEELDWQYMKRATPYWDRYRTNHPVLPLPPPYRFSDTLTVADWDPTVCINLFFGWEGTILPGQRLAVVITHYQQGNSSENGKAEKWLR